MFEVSRCVAAATPVLSYFLASAAIVQAAPASPQAPTAGPNEKVCETITLTGSRLATKRICATRAEWEERRRSDREEIDKAQRSPCVIQTTGATGRPSC